MACNKYGLMTFVTQSVSTNENFTWAWPKWNDLWPILPKSTFLKTYPIPMGHDTKTVIYLNYIFRFGLGLRWVISFSVSCFSLFYDLFISRWSDSSQIFWFFRARSIYRKIWMERKLLSIDRTTKWLTSSMTHSVKFIFRCVSRGMNKKVWSSGTVYQVNTWIHIPKPIRSGPLVQRALRRGEPDVLPCLESLKLRPMQSCSQMTCKQIIDSLVWQKRAHSISILVKTWFLMIFINEPNSMVYRIVISLARPNLVCQIKIQSCWLR